MSFCSLDPSERKATALQVPGSSKEVIDDAPNLAKRYQQPSPRGQYTTPATAQAQLEPQTTYESFKYAIEYRNVPMLTAMLASVNSGLAWHPISNEILFDLITHSIPKLIPLCINLGAKYSGTYSDGMTLLHVACAMDSVDGVKALLPYFADVNVRDSRGRTPLDCIKDTTKSQSVIVFNMLRSRGGVHSSFTPL